MPPSPAPVRSSGYKPRKSKGGALWMVLILGIAGIGGLWAFAPEIPRRFLGMTKGDNGSTASAGETQTTSDDPVPTKKSDVSKDSSTSAKEVDLNKIITITKNSALTELQKETQFEDFSGFITVTGKIARSMRSPVDKSRLLISICPIDSDLNRSRDIRCDVRFFSKEVMEAAPGTPVRITGQAKYESAMLGFFVRDSKAELITTPMPKSGAGDATVPNDAGAEPKDPLQGAREKGHTIGLEMVASEQKTKALVAEAADAERAGNTTRLRAIKSQINQLLAEKSVREKAGMKYVGGLTPAERDAYIEGIQAAQAGK